MTSEGSKSWLKAKRVGLIIASALISINISTGGPFLAVWVGSKIQGAVLAFEVWLFFFAGSSLPAA